MRNGQALLCASLLIACGPQVPAERGVPRTAPTSSFNVRRVVAGRLAVDLSGARAVIHGLCPTECCRYGPWIVAAVPVWERPDTLSPRRGILAYASAVKADSGLVILDSVGLAVVLRDTLDVPTGRRFLRGDSLVLLTEGETGWNAVWRDTITSEIHEFASAIRIIRRPSRRWHWWAYITSESQTLHGWTDVSLARPSGADACGG